jgi:hypothetical protein
MSPKDDIANDEKPFPQTLPPEAKRALEEAEARRKLRSVEPDRPGEVGGSDGPEPTRFGDWEKGGIASDF